MYPPTGWLSEIVIGCPLDWIVPQMYPRTGLWLSGCCRGLWVAVVAGLLSVVELLSVVGGRRKLREIVPSDRVVVGGVPRTGLSRVVLTGLYG
jgi:hypothetical protein